LDFLLAKVLPFLIAPIYWAIASTWRIRESGPPEVLEKFVNRKGASSPCLYAHWHGDELVLIGYYRFRKLVVLSSLSKDGSIMAKTLSLLGYRVFRGSSSRGGAKGLIGMIKAVKQGAQAALAVDGPKGPLHQAKPGIVELALRTGKPIVPLRCRAKKCWYIPKAWNHSYLPKPFSVVEVEYENPLEFPKDSDVDEVCALLNEKLNLIKGQPLRNDK
jgi:lysophospholipid acyltransferase (LPLAT)-like uncharacterized protein